MFAYKCSARMAFVYFSRLDVDAAVSDLPETDSISLECGIDKYH